MQNRCQEGQTLEFKEEEVRLRSEEGKRFLKRCPCCVCRGGIYEGWAGTEEGAGLLVG